MIHFNFREIRVVVIRRVRGLVMGSLEAWLIQPYVGSWCLSYREFELWSWGDSMRDPFQL